MWVTVPSSKISEELTMDTQKVKRKLTAILSADVKGYSRLMWEDEMETLRLNRKFPSVMPAQAGIQCFEALLDSRFRGNDKPASYGYLCNV